MTFAFQHTEALWTTNLPRRSVVCESWLGYWCSTAPCLIKFNDSGQLCITFPEKVSRETEEVTALRNWQQRTLATVSRANWCMYYVKKYSNKNSWYCSSIITSSWRCQLPVSWNESKSFFAKKMVARETSAPFAWSGTIATMTSLLLKMASFTAEIRISSTAWRKTWSRCYVIRWWDCQSLLGKGNRK